MTVFIVMQPHEIINLKVEVKSISHTYCVHNILWATQHLCLRIVLLMHVTLSHLIAKIARDIK